MATERVVKNGIKKGSILCSCKEWAGWDEESGREWTLRDYVAEVAYDINVMEENRYDEDDPEGYRKRIKYVEHYGPVCRENNIRCVGFHGSGWDTFKDSDEYYADFDHE